jgi:hypothetical protein
VEPEGVRARQRAQRRRAARVADVRRRARDERRSGRDLAIRHAQDDGVAAGGQLAAAERLGHRIAGVTQGGGQRPAHPTAPDNADGRHIQWRGSGGFGGGVPFQFPHARYRSVD